ncbi:SCO3933 family regulatory protein [Streptomyces griseoaurantiacus]|uniref:SCO3933 family regulatory protein n=1 Tax=Streptomyces griseoaurantiacus TaxID=68213 RepID=UPI0036C80619
MPSFKIDLSTAIVFVATAPEPKMANKKTGERAVDRDTGAGLSTVGLLVSDEGEGNLYQVTIPETGVPEDLMPGTPVKVVGLKARDWENTFNGEKRHGIAFRAVAVTPAV